MPRISGEVLFFGETYKRVRHRVAYVPQRTTVDWDFPVSALDVVAMGLYRQIGWFRPVTRKYRQQALAALERVSMQDFARRQISQLSGGQQQRVFLARALAQGAELYLMDEPFAGVDAATEEAIIGVLRELRSGGQTVIVVHHDLQTVSEYFDDVLMMNMRLIAAGPGRHGAHGRESPQDVRREAVADRPGGPEDGGAAAMNGFAPVIAAINFASYNTRVVLLGASLLGLAAGIIGTFLLLRRRALIGDVVGHCALPGIAVAFLVIERASPGAGKNLPALLMGATLAGLLGAQTVSLIKLFTRVDSDTALAVVLSVFYGAGVSLLSVVQRLASGSSAGLKDFLNGQTAAIVGKDVWIFTIASLVIVLVTGLLFKEFTLLCFDEDYAATRGLPTRLLDMALTLLATAVSVVGMQTVGLLLVTAILVTPPATARFWTNDIRVMALLAAAVGAASSAGGVIASAAVERLPAGPMIVLSGGAVFLFSLAFGREKGVVWQWAIHRRERLRADRIDLLRSLYESVERESGTFRDSPSPLILAVVPKSKIKPLRTWSSRRLNQALRSCVREGLLARTSDDGIAITRAAFNEGARVVRNRRLWELYLQRFADVSPAGIDRNKDLLDHALDPALVAQLESALHEARRPS